ncbi:MAG: helix-turn-helix domain-containing protein [Chloroflexota bacterium]|nr:helix-turn-helix domain-containing protein [Chloroflexota bacterium]
MDTFLADPEVRAYWERTAFARAIANQVIRYRIDHNLSQRGLAKRLGVSQALVGRLELGEHEPRLSTLRTLARVLGMRFSIEIHPAGPGPVAGLGSDEPRVDRLIADGVETLIRAS